MSSGLLPISLRDSAYSKYKLRFLFRSAGFILIVGGFCAYNYLTNSTSNSPAHLLSSTSDQFRRLDAIVADDDDCDLDKADPPVLILAYIAGVVYMFLALAIACDEFFVPALEEMASDRHMHLSPDVAGATLMAAGGSAPELFTSFIGTFKESDIGFGTIVGSAVFNVLFVIAMCSFLSKDVLTLTWWPLFRDCVYYTIGLATLAIFVGVISKDEIEMWEAIVLFSMYIGYTILMKYHESIYAWICNTFLNTKDGAIDDDANHQSIKTLHADAAPAHMSFNRHATFRAGVLKLLHDPYSWLNTAGVGIVSKIAGDVGEVFKKIDKNSDGFLALDELKIMFQELEMPLSDAELAEVMKQLDEDGDGQVNTSPVSYCCKCFNTHLAFYFRLTRLSSLTGTSVPKIG